MYWNTKLGLCLFAKSVLVVLVHSVTVPIIIYGLMGLLVTIDNDAID